MSKTRGGHSLIEVLIGLTILAIALGSAFALSINTSNMFSRTQRVAAAVYLADYKMEELRNTSFDYIVDGYDGNPLDGTGAPISSGGSTGQIYYRWWTVTDNDPATDMKTIVVLVAWYERGILRAYPLVGVVSR
jgi:prepilin-type N-terminal cleavage/methylation domain-containing protein